jgi:hypothetical protein
MTNPSKWFCLKSITGKKRARLSIYISMPEICGQTDYHFDSGIAKVVLSLDLPPSKLDIGKLTYEYILENEKYPDARHFVLDKLKEARSSEEIMPKTWFYMVLVELDVY